MKVLIDWEYVGYFLLGMERWLGILDMCVYRKRVDNLFDVIVKFFFEEYLECYEEWNDKSEL